MRFASFFSGAGMFDLALIRAGFERVGACEKDAFARAVYAARLGAPDFFPDDITTVRAEDIPDADVWIAGWPCQDMSVAGKRAGVGEGTRSGLVFDLLRLAKVKRPTWIIGENVPGMLSGTDEEEEEDDEDTVRDVAPRGVDEPADGSASWFGSVLAALADSGYHDVAWRVLDARWWGVAQRRRRVFVVAHLGDGAGAKSVLFEPEGVRRNLAKGRTTGARAARRAAGGADAGGLASAIAASAGHHGRSSPRGDGADNLIVSALGASSGGADDNDAQGNRLVASAIRGGGRRGHRVDAEGAAGGHLIAVKQGRRSAGADGSGETWTDAPAPTLNGNENHVGTRATVLVHGMDGAGADIAPPPPHALARERLGERRGGEHGAGSRMSL